MAPSFVQSSRQRLTLTGALWRPELERMHSCCRREKEDERRTEGGDEKSYELQYLMVLDALK